MRTLVTGATGFVGSHIVDACLRRGDRVRVLARPSSDLSYLRTLHGVEIVTGDLASAEAVERATRDIDVVHHSAARVNDYGSRWQFMEANVIATQLLLDAAKRNGVGRFVFVSSPSVVTDERAQIDIDESYPYPARFVNLYSETKALAEQSVLAANAPGFVTCALRPRGVWGPRDRSGPLPRVVAKMAAGRLPDMSGGKEVLASLCYCTNAAEACALAARSDRVGGKAYFVTDGEKTDIWKLAAVLSDLFGVPPIRKRIHPALLRALVEVCELLWKIPRLSHRRSPPISRYSVALLTLTATYDTSAATRDFGYRPVVDQKTGLAELKAWVDSIGGVQEFIRFAR